MIFSHFKRGKGIRFDDGFRHSARSGVAPDPLVATYDAILATDPTVPVLLQLTEYRGQQVLWQDPACTVPVEEIGDPIGGVRHPETGEILAVQTTDADRPVWGGREVGAEFDGSKSLLSDFDHGSGDVTFFLAASEDNPGRRNTFFSSQVELGTADSRGVTCAKRTEERAQIIVGDGESNFNENAENIEAFSTPFAVSLRLDASASNISTFVNGNQVMDEPAGIDLSAIGEVLLALGDDPYSGPVSLEGSIKMFFGVSSALSSSEIINTSDLLL